MTYLLDTDTFSNLVRDHARVELRRKAAAGGQAADMVRMVSIAAGGTIPSSSCTSALKGATRVARANSSAASVPRPDRNAMLAWRRSAPTTSGGRLFKQYCLYLRPLPQGHGSFLPGALTPSGPKPIGQCGFWS
jgi:hypothetical protein